MIVEHTLNLNSRNTAVRSIAHFYGCMLWFVYPTSVISIFELQIASRDVKICITVLTMLCFSPMFN